MEIYRYVRALDAANNPVPLPSNWRGELMSWVPPRGNAGYWRSISVVRGDLDTNNPADTADHADKVYSVTVIIGDVKKAGWPRPPRWLAPLDTSTMTVPRPGDAPPKWECHPPG